MAKYTQEQLDTLFGNVNDNVELFKNNLGMPTFGRPVTRTLYVSPNGDNTDGLNWNSAYNRLQDALDACSTDVNESTLILLGVNDTYYDIDRAGNPTWSANVEIFGAHRKWAIIRNTNVGATSVLKLIGKASIQNCAISQEDCVNGLIINSNSFRIRKCEFNSENCTTPVTSIYIDGSATNITGGILDDVKIIGNKSYTTGLRVNNVVINDFSDLHTHNCLVALQIDGPNSRNNIFEGLDIGNCEKGIYVTAGIGEHFYNVKFHGNTMNIDDAVDSNIWNLIYGSFPTIIQPLNLVGVSLTCGNNAFGVDTELRAAITSTKPFKILSYHLEPSTEENILIRFSSDNGLTYIRQEIFSSKKDKATAGSAGLEYIFNKGTRISASAYAKDAGRTVKIWLEIQEI